GTVTGAAEAGLQLLYWNGAAWAPVLGSGGATPVKDTTDNLDATVSGGRFSLTFDGTSTPKITELGGTFFALAPRDPASLLTALQGVLAGMKLDKGLATDLSSKLDQAQKKLGKGKDACNPLDDFLHQVIDEAGKEK